MESEFFAWCDPEVPALVHWARWLRIDHEADEGIFAYDADLALVIVEAMIADMAEVRNMPVAEMRRAVRVSPSARAIRLNLDCSNVGRGATH